MQLPHLIVQGAALQKPENRAAYKQDDGAYLARWPLTEAQRQAILERGWNGMLRPGACATKQDLSSDLTGTWSTVLSGIPAVHPVLQQILQQIGMAVGVQIIPPGRAEMFR